MESSSKRRLPSDRIYYIIVYALLTLVFVLIAFPLVFVLSASFSSPSAVAAGRVILWPVEFGIEGYKAVFRNSSILSGYLNTLIYAVAGTVLNVAMTLICAYPLSRRDLKGRNAIMLLFSFTMIFSGGIIPSYILMKDLHLLNTRFAMIIPGAISVYNMIITRTFIQNSIPEELLQASQIDGCSDAAYFFRVVLPLSKSVIATITLFYVVGHWNAYFNAFLYLNNRALMPLQIILREILIANTIDFSQVVDPELAQARQGLADLLKYSLIIVSSVPMLILYPFIQKHFVTGVMIGAIKG
ncbi:MAG: carbohydrate ABC transporter permease [Clostridiales bacterium]|jgi:multiple sugar transport system permease protein/putative aldouronate transport system permease protein|nr:carbohydrate ABC transporter permease [Clostridiales bacterium]